MSRLLSTSWWNHQPIPYEGWLGRPVFNRLLEMAIVVLVVVILMMIAIPLYRVAIVKSISTEGILMSNEGRLQVHEYYAVTGKWLTQKSAMNEGQHNEDLTQFIDQGAVTVIYPESKKLRLHGEKLTIRPQVYSDGQSMTFGWSCGYTQANDYLPVGINRTDIPAKHLTRSCR